MGRKVWQRESVMQVDQIRNLTEAEIATRKEQTEEQLFRLRFQKSLGNNEGVKKLRELRKDIARIQTVIRQRDLGHAVVPVVSASRIKNPRRKKEA